ncbi:MAG TPA: hybrid sensor histidine kinase/response regulator, partial [Cyclobacteriaceae bacterium]|nr:hybrid sensor histidine kinase/response regulator [Cyclobacteriaceae bacterium]
ILILEDVEEDVELVRRELMKEKLSFTLYRVDKKDEYLSSLVEIKPNVILSDHSLPQFNSVEALEISQRIGSNIPFILVTGTVSEEFAVTCLKNGADNYVLKGNLSRLPSAITNALQQKATEKNRKLAERTLHQQNKMLVKVNQELDRFVYSTSHNLRAPLMSVLGLLNISRKEVENKDYGRLLEYFGMMSASIEKLDNTLKEIVDYSKNARVEVKIEKIELYECLQECIEKLSFLEGAKEIKKEIIIDGGNIIYCDSDRLNVILINIISNAIKYRDINKEEKKLSITVHSYPYKTSISIQDNGVGIFSNYVDKVFDMFYRASDKSNGAGLGLYIVKETVEKLGGKISIDSEIETGTTVEIDIPFGSRSTK